MEVDEKNLNNHSFLIHQITFYIKKAAATFITAAFY
jgi:hypothetical protein